MKQSVLVPGFRMFMDDWSVILMEWIKANILPSLTYFKLFLWIWNVFLPNLSLPQTDKMLEIGSYLGPGQFEHINRLINISVITLSGFHCKNWNRFCYLCPPKSIFFYYFYFIIQFVNSHTDWRCKTDVRLVKVILIRCLI